MADSVSPYVIGGLGTVIGVSCIASFIMISRFIGSKDRWSPIQKELSAGVWIMSMVGSLALFLSGVVYFSMKPNQEKIMYFVFVVTFLAMGLASSALGVALIHKNE
jgi:hypothetical protein